MAASSQADLRHVALLRGVNVGRAKRVAMADWRAQLQALGCTGVRTVLNSGNAVFDSAAHLSTTQHAERIHAALRADFELDVAVVVKTARQWQAIAAGHGLSAAADDPARLLVLLAADADALQGVDALLPKVAPPDELQRGCEAAYLWCQQGILQSPAALALGGAVGRGITSRNWATVQRIQAALAA
jgi:uncharacterized protein (DUF1697 family)